MTSKKWNCNEFVESTNTSNKSEYVCYCNFVTEDDIVEAMKKGAKTVQDVIILTGAMKNSNCPVNNPKGVCCYPDIVATYNKHIKLINEEI